MTHLFQLGDFQLSSGAKSGFKIDCDSLSDADIKTLAEMIRQLVGPFASVEGVPQGGLRLAAALKPFAGLNGAHLIVDDVLTTGGSMERLKGEKVLANHPGGIIGAVVFARGQCPYWVKPLFQLPECFWTKPRQR